VICFTLSLRMSVYVCPQPTNMMGAPDSYTMDNAAPTFSSTVSNLVRTTPSMSRGTVCVYHTTSTCHNESIAKSML
jgi:hypothetical protein